MSDITVCIPSIPKRAELVATRAIPSIHRQTLQPDAVAICVDNHKNGAWHTRNKTIEMANTKWIAFLDDDDAFLPRHLETLHNIACEQAADVVWGWFEVVGGTDPFPQHRGRQFNLETPHIFPITTLVNRELILDSKAEFCEELTNVGNWGVQDLPFWGALWNAGGKFYGTDEITWQWYHHETNTSGLPTRW